MTSPIRILELRSVRGTGGGPEKTILSSAATSDPKRFAVTVCYIRDLRDRTFAIDESAAKLPVDYVEILERHSFDPSIWPTLRTLARERRIDIVHAHDYKTNLLARLLALVEPVIPLSTVHGWTGHTSRERLLYYPFDKRLLSSFPRLIAVSGEIRDELLRHGVRRNQVTTVLNGIDPAKFRRDRRQEAAIRRTLGLTNGDIVIGGVGRLEPQKRFDLLISVFARLRFKRPQLKLIIAGDGTLRDALQTQATRLGLGAACRLLGHRTDIAEMHHAFDLFVQSSDYEGTSNALLEAMALETPIVATRVGGTADMVRDGVDGLLVNPAAADELLNALDNALTRTEQTKGRVAAARHRTEHELSFQARMRAVEAVYDTLVRTHGQARISAAVPA